VGTQSFRDRRCEQSSLEIPCGTLRHGLIWSKLYRRKFRAEGFGHRKWRPKPSAVLFVVQEIQYQYPALKLLTGLCAYFSSYSHVSRLHSVCVFTVEDLSLPVLHDGHLLRVTVVVVVQWHAAVLLLMGETTTAYSETSCS